MIKAAYLSKQVFCTFYNAEKINPVASDEVSAGDALGLSFDEIMREIVIPNGRPGMLQKLNRRKMLFK